MFHQLCVLKVHLGALFVDNDTARRRAVENAGLYHNFDSACDGAYSVLPEARAQAEHLILGAP